MIGPNYWGIGIIVEHKWDDQWTAKADFCDNGFCDSESSQGTLTARYQGPLSQVIDVVKADFERLGFRWENKVLYYRGDGEDPKHKPPANWRERLDAEAERIGWESYGATDELLVAAQERRKLLRQRLKVGQS